jgi:hypothetical protein
MQAVRFFKALVSARRSTRRWNSEEKHRPDATSTSQTLANFYQITRRINRADSQPTWYQAGHVATDRKIVARRVKKKTDEWQRDRLRH